MNGDLKHTFILKAVQDYIQVCERTFEVLLSRMKVDDTGALRRSFRNEARAVGSGATGELIFKEYGRFVDMGVGRGQPLGALKATEVALLSRNLEGKALVKKRDRKPKKFYSPIIYGKLTYLQNRLLYGYTEETIAMLKKEIK